MRNQSLDLQPDIFGDVPAPTDLPTLAPSVEAPQVPTETVKTVDKAGDSLTVGGPVDNLPVEVATQTPAPAVKQLAPVAVVPTIKERPESAFMAAIIAAGLTPPEYIEADGQLHRFASNGKRGDKSGWYVLHLDGVPAGAFGCWRAGFTQDWCSREASTLTEAEKQTMRQRMQQAQAARDAAQAQAQQQAQGTAQARWDAASPATANHSYLAAKSVQAHGLRVEGSLLLVPMRDANGTLHSLQTIGTDLASKENKRFLSKGKKKGCFYVIGTFDPAKLTAICEGFATGASIHEATGLCVAVAFDAGNLLPVAQALRAKHPTTRLALAADNDTTSEGNPGLTKATEAARAVGALLALAVSSTDPDKKADFNDVHQAEGLEAVARLIDAAVTLEELPPSKTPPAPTDAQASTSTIPTENERPAYRVFEDWHSEGGEKFRPGVWLFAMRQTGKGENATLVPTQQWICSPLHVEAITADAYDGSYGRMLRFKNTRGNWRQWAMPMHMLAGDGNELRAILLSMGVELSPKGRDALAMYLQSQHPKNELLCVAQSGWADNKCRAFVLPDGAIGPDAAGVVYQSEDREATRLYRAAGTLQGWQSGVSAMAVGNPMLALGLCLAFAGPLLAKVRGENGGLHYFGDSSTGKTSILYAGGSTWGEPEAYKRTWRTTDNGLEGAAAMVNDGLLTLDEIKQAAPKVVDETIYMIGNGQGKGRANRSGGGRAVVRWRCSVLSTGEMSIATKLAEGGLRIHAGQEVRFLDVPCDNRAAGGVWNDLHGHPTPKALSDSVATAAKTHYGHAGKAFLERLSAEDGDLNELLATIQARPEFNPGGGSQEQRVAGRFALLALAGELATDYGITGWPEGEAIRAAEAVFAAWRGFRDSQDGANAERGQVVRQVLGFIEQHGDSRFSDADTSPDPARALLVRDRAGYWRNTDNGRVYLFNSSGLKAALKGYDFKRGIRWLHEAGLLPPIGPDGKSSKGLTIQGNRGRWYEVRPDAAIEAGT